MKALGLFTFILILSFGAFATDPIPSPVPAVPVPSEIIITNPAITREDPNAITCEYGIELEPTLQSMLNNFAIRCDTIVEHTLSLENLDQRLRNFKDNVCGCYNTDRARTLDDLNLQGLNESTRRRIQSDVSGDSIVSPAAINQNIMSQNILLNEQRNGVMIQASILSPDPQERDALTRAYSGRDAFDRMIRGANKSLSEVTANLPDRSEVTGTFAAPRYDDSSLQADGDSCPSMREFRHFRQFPEDNDFYQDLLSPRNSTYREDDWNFEKLKEQLSLVSRSKRILSLETAKADPDTAWIIRRMDFLMRNPLLKNFFQQSEFRDSKKRHLYNLVQQTFKPTAGPGSCLNAPGACQGAAALKSNIYQTGLREFFRDSDNARRVVSLDVDAMERTLNSLPERVARTPFIPNANALSSLSPWMDRIMGSSILGKVTGPSANSHSGWLASQTGTTTPMPTNGTSRFGVPEMTHPENTCMFGTCDNSPTASLVTSDFPSMESFHRSMRLSEINQTCNMLSDTNLNGHGFIFSQLEQEWSEQLCDPSRPINGATCRNPALIEVAGKICSRYRLNTTDVYTITQFRADGGCADPAKNCLSEYILRTAPVQPGSEQTANTWSTLFTIAKITNFSGEESAEVGATVNRNNSLSDRDYVRTVGAEITRDYTSISRQNSNISQAANAVTSSSSTSSSSTLASSTIASSQATQIVPEVIVPLSGVSAEPGTASNREVVRTQVRQSESDAQGIRDEISSLTDSLIRERREPASNQDSALITSLTERLRMLENRLEAQDQETTRLRRQLARRPSEPLPANPSQNNPDVQENDGRMVSSSGAQIQAAPQNVQQSVAGGVTPVLPGPQSGSSLGGGSRQALSPVSKSASVSGVSNSLTKYGVQSASAQGAITVANPSSTIDYQTLRSESADSVVQLLISIDEFNLLASNNQEALNRYLDRARSTPGEVVRLAFTAEGTTNQMELFIVKTGDQISIVPSNGVSRGIASESAPVPAAIPQRTNTLEQLRQEVVP